MSYVPFCVLSPVNFAIAYAQEKIVLLIRIGHTRVALKHKKTDLSLETSSEINFECIICILSPFEKTDREFQMFGNLRFITIFDR